VSKICDVVVRRLNGRFAMFGAPERSGDRTDEEYWHIASTPAIMNINCHSILSSVPVVYEAVKGFGIYFRL
jgi:hypothetical protein